MKIEEAIKSNFKSEYHKAHVNVIYSAAWMSQQSTQLLKPYNVSWQQFNILRILRGMHPEPATVKLLTERMIDKMSNASRLVDKLMKKEFVKRQTCTEDRRRVNIAITSLGLEVLASASKEMEANMENYMEAITQEEALELNRILDKLRTKVNNQK